MGQVNDVPSHMTKIADMSIYDKTPLNSLLQDQTVWDQKVCSNNDLGLILNFFMDRSNLSMLLLGKIYTFLQEKY